MKDLPDAELVEAFKEHRNAAANAMSVPDFEYHDDAAMAALREIQDRVEVRREMERIVSGDSW